MKLDVTQNLLNLNGEPMPIVFQACPMCGRPMEERGFHTLRSACEAALSADYQSEQRSGGISGEEKFKRYCLAVKIHNNDEVSFLAEEIVMLKKVLGLRWPPEIMGPARLILEPAESEVDDE